MLAFLCDFGLFNTLRTKKLPSFITGRATCPIECQEIRKALGGISAIRRALFKEKALV